MIHLWPILARYNTLRNQILFGFLLVMLCILCVVGIVTFRSVSTLLQNNAEKHIQQTAIQANGRLEAILNQIDSLTTQVSTSAYVQQLLLEEWSGKQANFTERQGLLPSMNIVQTYTQGVNSVELYSGSYRRLFPLDGNSLDNKIDSSWIERAKESKGRLVWIGNDPADPGSVLAIRCVTLIDHWFTPGGYLLVRMDRKVFEISEPMSGDGARETMLLVGQDNSLIAANDDRFTQADIAPLIDSEEQAVTIHNQNYMLVKQQSAAIGWILLILTPVGEITNGISVLRTAILLSAGIGTVLFMVLSFVLSTLISRPIFKLIKTMRSVRFGGLKPTAVVSSTIEINELNHTYNQMVDHMNELIRLVYEKEILQSRTELKALQAQIHPHFLFNTLEALYWSLQEREEEELAEFVVAMSDLFRYTITGPNKDEWVALSDELEHIDRYLLIMKMRFGDRLTWRIESSPDYAAVQVPKLLIQPLVENAILHGMESRIEPGEVTVSVKLADDGEHLAISVSDDGRGMEEDALHRLESALRTGRVTSSKGSGMGIFNVQQRLRLYFDASDSAGRGIVIHSRKDEGTTVKLMVPIYRGEG